MEQSQESILKMIRQEIDRVAPGAKAILFGPRTRSGYRDDSDWDILILIDKPRLRSSDFDAIYYPLCELGIQINERISPKLYTVDEWEKRSFTPFYKNVESEGIVLL